MTRIGEIPNTPICLAAYDVVLSQFKGITDDFYKVKNRNRELVVPRQIFIYLLHNFTRYSLKQIGGICGGRDHSTVLHSIHAVEDMLEVDRKYKAIIRYCSAEVFNVSITTTSALEPFNGGVIFDKQLPGMEAAHFIA